jgi:hypothetical protein
MDFSLKMKIYATVTMLILSILGLSACNYLTLPDEDADRTSLEIDLKF